MFQVNYIVFDRIIKVNSIKLVEFSMVLQETDPARIILLGNLAEKELQDNLNSVVTCFKEWTRRTYTEIDEMRFKGRLKL